MALVRWGTIAADVRYADIIKRNLKDSSGKEMPLNNVLMQLRKCCNHPFLHEWPLDHNGLSLRGKWQATLTRV